MTRTITLAILLFVTTLAGCSWMGPEVIRSGRPAYNDAILTTNDEQVLQNVVRMRFQDSPGFLTVSSVTANVSVSATASVNAGFGPVANYQGNLIPFTGTVTTEQNPTISYTPVSGDRVMRQFMGETPLDLGILMINQAPKLGWVALVRRVNDIRNPDFIKPPALVPDARFAEITELIGDLQERGALYWVRLEGAKTGYAMILHSYSPSNVREVARLLDILQVPKPEREGADAIVPIQLSVGSPAPGTIAIETRSLFSLTQLAAASIELPPDMETVATRYPDVGSAGKGIRILSSATRPSQARVAIEYRGRWFYIEDTDHASKQWFIMLVLLASAQVPDSATGIGPVLTIPAGKR